MVVLINGKYIYTYIKPLNSKLFTSFAISNSHSIIVEESINAELLFIRVNVIHTGVLTIPILALFSGLIILIFLGESVLHYGK